MTITLTSEQEKIISERVESGAYKSAHEVIAASLSLLKAREEGKDALRQEIMRGITDIEENRFSTISSDDELEEFSSRIIEQSLQR